MASLTKTYTKEKLEGRVFTPFFIVDKILDDVKYNVDTFLGKTILDPACGDGRFLVRIVKRIIEYSDLKDLKKNLENVHGWDISKTSVSEAIENLDELVAPFGVKIDWNIKVLNSLHLDGQKFDFVVGNPPYIRVQHLEKGEREFIQNNYSFCSLGSTDIYLAFFELGVKLLKDDGFCAYITPNTFFHTSAGFNLRDYFVKNKNLVQITNYNHIQLFDDATTYSAITVFNKKINKNFRFQYAIDKQFFKERFVDFVELENQKFWQLSVEKNSKKDGVRLGDIVSISVGLATLADKLYIMPYLEKTEKYVILQSKYNGIIKIEKGILKPIVKASKMKSKDDEVVEYILFPYKKVNEKHTILSEDEIEKKFPLAYKYLLEIKHLLDKRDNGKPNKIAWYAFGRSQGLDSSFGKKILFSPMNKKPNFVYYQYEDVTFYSGYCMKYDGDYDYLLEKINSKDMEEYIKVSARDFRNGWKSYNKKIVEEFVIKD